MDAVKLKIVELVNQVLNEYGVIVATLIIGILVGWYSKWLLSDRKYIKQINLRLEERDQRIAELNCLVLEKLNKVTVEKKDRTFFKQLKNYFKKFTVNK